jgi:aromatase
MILDLTDTGLVQGSRSDVFHCFWRAELWPKLTSHVKRVEILEEQEGWQRYAMYVDVDGKEYSMITQRIAVTPNSISFQQPKPAAVMLGHAGIWRFDEAPSGTQVTVIHRVHVNVEKAMELLDAKSPEQACEKLTGNLHKNGMAMITSVDAFLKSEEGKSLVTAQVER